MPNVRIPTQKRSIDKYNKIIDKGFELMCNQGYYNTTTNDIAKYTGVSVGIIYQYFDDKKDIFYEGAKRHCDEIMFPLFSYIDDIKELPDDIRPVLKEIIKKNKKQHNSSIKAHQELSSMLHLDEDIGNIFKESELALSNKLYDLLVSNGDDKTNLEEKTHIIVDLIDNLAHEESYHKHKTFNYDAMEDIVIDMIVNILKK